LARKAALVAGCAASATAVVFAGDGGNLLMEALKAHECAGYLLLEPAS
jgi:hypothetical protein